MTNTKLRKENIEILHVTKNSWVFVGKKEDGKQTKTHLVMFVFFEMMKMMKKLNDVNCLQNLLSEIDEEPLL
jgi:hypothetical protein